MCKFGFGALLCPLFFVPLFIRYYACSLSLRRCTADSFVGIEFLLSLGFTLTEIPLLFSLSGLVLASSTGRRVHIAARRSDYIADSNLCSFITVSSMSCTAACRQVGHGGY